MRRIEQQLGVVAVLGTGVWAAAGGCALIIGVVPGKDRPDAGGGGGGGVVPCKAPADCPQGDDCETAACTGGVCGLVALKDGTACEGGACQAGKCTCTDGGTACAGTCTDTNSDAMNCGACGKACTAPTTACSGGLCICPSGQAACSGGCVDTTTDAMNCGGCGKVCTVPGSVCSESTCACPNGWIVCGSACLDQSGDPHNCGSCARDCMGASCESGLCQADVIASGQENPTDIVVNATDVYWNNRGASGSVMRVPSSGGTVAPVATSQPSSAYLALNGAGVYWTTTTGNAISGFVFSIMKALLTGGGPTSLASVGPGSKSVGGLAADTTNVYWFDPNALNVSWSPSGGGGPATAVTLGPIDAPARSLIAAGGYLFWSGSNGVDQAPIGGSFTDLATTSANALAVAGSNVYLNGGSAVAKVPIGGGTVVTLAMTQSSALIATDGVYVFYVDGATLKKVSVSGGTPIPLAACAAAGLAVDATHAYWTDAAGTVNRVAK